MRRFLVAASLVLSLILVGGDPAQAATTVAVTTPAGGRYHPGETTALLVTITSDAAIEGTLTVLFDGRPYATAAFDVPGGSSKKIVVITETPPWGSDGSVRVDADGEAAAHRFTLTPAGSNELVAVMAQLAVGGLAESADLSVDLGRANLYELEADLLASGPDAISLFSHIIATSADLAAVGVAGTETLSQWVAGGGNLIVDEPVGTPLGGELDRPVTDTGTARLGLGTITFAENRIEAAGFDGIVAPTRSRSTQDTPFGNFFGDFPATALLAADAGVRVPGIGSMVIILLVYIVLAGPILWVVLRRRRREPAIWLLVPVFAVVATAGIWAVGQYLRGDVTAAHATLVVDLPATRSVSTQTLIASPNGGWAAVKLPDGWRASGGSGDEQQFFDGPFGGSAQTITAITTRGDELGTDLPPGGISVVTAEVSQPRNDASWEIDVVAEGNTLSITVTNRTAHDLEEIMIAVGQSIKTLGGLSVGESDTVSLVRSGGLSINGDRFSEQLASGDVFGRNQSPVNPSVVLSWLNKNNSARGPGNVIVLGWTREAHSPLTTRSGNPIENGRTGYMAVEVLDDSSAVVSSATNLVEILRGTSVRVADPARGFEAFPLALSVTPPASADLTSPLVIDIPRTIAALDVWDGTAWQPIGLGEVPNSNSIVVNIPESALADGSLYLRAALDQDFWNLSDPFPELRPPRDTDEIHTFGESLLEAADPEPDDA